MRMNDIEEKVIRELSILDLAKFMAELKQAQVDITNLKRQPIISAFDLNIMEI